MRADAQMEKVCTDCGETKPRDEFTRNGINAEGEDPRKPQCKPCNTARVHRRDLWKKYGVTPEQYDEMFEAQGGLCGICFSPPKNKRLSVDHNHDTDAVRGLLCNTCNMAIGLLQDSPEVLGRAADWVRE